MGVRQSLTHLSACETLLHLLGHLLRPMMVCAWPYYSNIMLCLADVPGRPLLFWWEVGGGPGGEGKCRGGETEEDVGGKLWLGCNIYERRIKIHKNNSIF